MVVGHHVGVGNLGPLKEQQVLKHLSSPGKDSYSCSFVTDKLCQRMTTLPCFDLNCKLLCSCGDSAGKSTTVKPGMGVQSLEPTW